MAYPLTEILIGEIPKSKGIFGTRAYFAILTWYFRFDLLGSSERVPLGIKLIYMCKSNQHHLLMNDSGLYSFGTYKPTLHAVGPSPCHHSCDYLCPVLPPKGYSVPIASNILDDCMCPKCGSYAATKAPPPLQLVRVKENVKLHDLQRFVPRIDIRLKLKLRHLPVDPNPPRMGIHLNIFPFVLLTQATFAYLFLT